MFIKFLEFIIFTFLYFSFEGIILGVPIYLFTRYSLRIKNSVKIIALLLAVWYSIELIRLPIDSLIFKKHIQGHCDRLTPNFEFILPCWNETWTAGEKFITPIGSTETQLLQSWYGLSLIFIIISSVFQFAILKKLFPNENNIYLIQGLFSLLSLLVLSLASFIPINFF